MPKINKPIIREGDLVVCKEFANAVNTRSMKKGTQLYMSRVGDFTIGTVANYDESRSAALFVVFSVNKFEPRQLPEDLRETPRVFSARRMNKDGSEFSPREEIMFCESSIYDKTLTVEIVGKMERHWIFTKNLTEFKRVKVLG